MLPFNGLTLPSRAGHARRRIPSLPSASSTRETLAALSTTQILTSVFLLLRTLSTSYAGTRSDNSSARLTLPTQVGASAETKRRWLLYVMSIQIWKGPARQKTEPEYLLPVAFSCSSVVHFSFSLFLSSLSSYPSQFLKEPVQGQRDVSSQPPTAQCPLPNRQAKACSRSTRRSLTLTCASSKSSSPSFLPPYSSSLPYGEHSPRPDSRPSLSRPSFRLLKWYGNRC